MKSAIRKILLEKGVVIGDLHKGCRSGAIHKAWGHIFTNHMRGDYLEFGVYLGQTFVESYGQFSQFKNWLLDQTTSSESWRQEVAKSYIDYKPIFYGFDTFEGMPVNDEENSTFGSGTFLSSLESVNQKCLEAFGKDKSYKLLKGLFQDQPEGIISGKIAILNIDSDLYESAKVALNICKAQMQVGMVLLMDDYNAFCASNLKGERKALLEFCQETGFEFEKWFTYQYSGQAFLLTSI